MESLLTLLQHAEGERDEALAQMQKARTRADAAQAQVDQLEAYRVDYQKRWTRQFQQAASIEIVQCFSGFNGRLDEAIAQQKQAAAQCLAQVERARALLQDREMRVASVRKLVERRALEQRRVEDRRDQKTTDEAAQRAGRNTMGLRMSAPFGL